ncbi:MAG: type IVB secretion system coupling complex protein DotM/IcmP [Gammaproteobacteria bacterium]|nr:type IVB secretion system coupling complex protein DotM/IcmP [Gammaproteobacteria bacterium]
MSQGGGQQQSDQTANFFWMIVLIFGAVIVFWFLDSRTVVIPVFWMRIHEIELMRYLAQAWTPVAQLLHITPPNMHQLDALQEYMQRIRPSRVSWVNFSAINVDLGQWTRYPAVIILGLLAAFVFFRGAAQFRHSYDMTTLRVVGQELWPQITPVLSLNLVKEDIGKGPWAMCQLPLEFCRQHELLLMKVVNNKKVWTLKQKPAYRLLALQLGPMWKGLDALPIHMKAIALICLARATGQRPVAKKILSQIAASAATGKLDFSTVSDQLRQFYNHRIIQWLEVRHAYMATLMASLLQIARSDGVLASAEFLWLKPVDRRMWFMLNNVGRRAAFVEVAGAYAHWKAEQKVGRALKTPMVKSAVDALDEALQNVLHIEKGDLWHTTSAD